MSAWRMASVMTVRPPASSIFIIIDVPERGSPDTTTMGSPYFRRRRKSPSIATSAPPRLQRHAEASLEREAGREGRHEEPEHDPALAVGKEAQHALGVVKVD